MVLQDCGAIAALVRRQPHSGENLHIHGLGRPYGGEQELPMGT